VTGSPRSGRPRAAESGALGDGRELGHLRQLEAKRGAEPAGDVGAWGRCPALNPIDRRVRDPGPGGERVHGQSLAGARVPKPEHTVHLTARAPHGRGRGHEGGGDLPNRPTAPRREPPGPEATAGASEPSSVALVGGRRPDRDRGPSAVDDRVTPDVPATRPATPRSAGPAARGLARLAREVAARPPPGGPLRGPTLPHESPRRYQDVQVNIVPASHSGGERRPGTIDRCPHRPAVTASRSAAIGAEGREAVADRCSPRAGDPLHPWERPSFAAPNDRRRTLAVVGAPS
jgi:hypothetical protein